MDDQTLYKRDKKAKEQSRQAETRISGIRFKDEDIEVKRVIKIGRDPGNDIVINDDPQVSRKHAIIEKEDEGYYLLDKDSTNGTYLNNNPIARDERVLLKAGDVIQVGKTKLKIH